MVRWLSLPSAFGAVLALPTDRISPRQGTAPSHRARDKSANRLFSERKGAAFALLFW